MTRAGMYQKVREALQGAFGANDYHEWLSGCAEALAALAALEAEERDTDRLLNVARGCHDYGGGYREDREAEIFHHGIQTVINALEAFMKAPNELQVRVLEGIGASTPPAPTAAECACRKALNRLLPLFHVRAKQTDFDYDPAGSSTTYIPNPEDLQFLESLVGRKIDENELYFSCGGNISSRYCVPQKLIGAALAAPRECQRLREENEHLRRRIHQSEGHNQFFERCESAWCNPDQKNNPASEGVGAAWKTPAQYDAELVAAKSEIARLTAEVDARVIQVTTQIRMDHEAIRQWESARDDIAAELREAVDAMRPFADVWDKRPPFDVTSPFRIDCEVGEYGAWHNTSTIVAAYDAKHGEKP